LGYLANRKNHVYDTWTRFGLRISKEAEALKEVVAKGPSKDTVLSKVSACTFMVCEISPTVTSGRFPAASNG
jgi:hypothetical protein